MTILGKDELARYSRHLPVIGLEGQERLKKAKVLCVGGGGLGCPALQYLAASGIGTLGVMDGDKVELSNLQRQILFREQDIGRNKAQVIYEQLRTLNSYVIWNVYQEFLSEANASALISHYDVILDATDNYSTRYLLNDLCRSLGKPLVSASIFQFDAQLSVFNFQQGPCYQCLYPEPPPAYLSPNCSLSGVLGVLPGVAGCLQAMEAIQVILGSPGVLSGTLLSMNLLTMQFKRFSISKQDCSQHPLIKHSAYPQCKDSLSYPEISSTELAELIQINEDSIQLLDVRESFERIICHIGGIHLPLSSFSIEAAKEFLDLEKQIVVYCKSGMRSAEACMQLYNSGFKVTNLKAGILGWIKDVDSSLTAY
ncbi:ThiF family adenylyltransferase [Legionella sp. km772]|uniref:ThiF family adenylyltransferase n=1 Tax=Legionella sp. km772 TaxID=2498111 RepID=UPI000F8CFA2A|nr:ThiF family adenylyltransferase [Legionella sp. km772]RUR08403.1 thiamine biosynthesis protein ThiF [Legionella sp. km772]